MKLLQEYAEKRKEILDYFGYGDDCENLTIEDVTDSYWHFIYEGVRWSSTKTALEEDDGSNYYENNHDFTDMAYIGEDYTMICVYNEYGGGGKYLQIFDNAKKIDIDEDEEDE
jgi:hypothetical protein